MRLISTVSVLGVVLLSTYSAEADELWHCKKGDRIDRVFLAFLQPDIELPCEVRVERGGIMHRVYHEAFDTTKCRMKAKNIIDQYEVNGWRCDSLPEE